MIYLLFDAQALEQAEKADISRKALRFYGYSVQRYLVRSKSVRVIYCPQSYQICLHTDICDLSNMNKPETLDHTFEIKDLPQLLAIQMMWDWHKESTLEFLDTAKGNFKIENSEEVFGD